MSTYRSVQESPVIKPLTTAKGGLRDVENGASAETDNALELRFLEHSKAAATCGIMAGRRIVDHLQQAELRRNNGLCDFGRSLQHTTHVQRVADPAGGDRPFVETGSVSALARSKRVAKMKARLAGGYGCAGPCQTATALDP